MRALFSSILVVSFAALPAAFVACGGSDRARGPVSAEDGGPARAPAAATARRCSPTAARGRGARRQAPASRASRTARRARSPGSVEVSGEWSQFARPGAAMVRGADGQWSVDAELPKGLHGYKLVVDGQ